MMRVFRIDSDELWVVEGERVLLIMSRQDGLEVEGSSTFSFARSVCGRCKYRGLIFRQPCEDCPKEVKPR